MKAKRFFFIEDISPNERLINLHLIKWFWFVSCDWSSCPLCDSASEDFSWKIWKARNYKLALIYDYEDYKVKSVLLTYYLYNQILRAIDTTKEISDEWTNEKREEWKRYKFLRKKSLMNYVDITVYTDKVNWKTEHEVKLKLNEDNLNRKECIYLKHEDEFDLESLQHVKKEKKQEFDKNKEIVINKIFWKTQYAEALKSMIDDKIKLERWKEDWNDISDILA